MPVSRKTVDFLGLRPERESFLADGVTIVYDSASSGQNLRGRAVEVSGHKTVALAADAKRVLGRIDHVEADGVVVVQTSGYCNNMMAGNGATLTPGLPIVGALNASAARGYIRNAAAVLAEARDANGTIIDATDGQNATVLLA